MPKTDVDYVYVFHSKTLPLGIAVALIAHYHTRRPTVSIVLVGKDYNSFGTLQNCAKLYANEYNAIHPPEKHVTIYKDSDAYPDDSLFFDLRRCSCTAVRTKMNNVKMTWVQPDTWDKALKTITTKDS
jgi:hypothetical protein